MKRLLLGIGLACLALGSAGCCCWEGSGWTPCPWPGCGWEPGCGWNGGGGCGWGGWCGWPCNRPGGCGEVYWGDWCTGNPHCSTCDDCANWVGPPTPGGNGLPPETYSRAHPYGNQVVRDVPSRSMDQNAPQMARKTRPPQRSQQMVRRAPSSQGAPQMTRRPPQNTPQMVRPGNNRQYPAGRPSPQMAQRNRPQEYEGAVQYLGTTDRLVKPAALPSSRSANPSTVARRGEPTLAEPDDQVEEESPSQVRRTSQRQYVR